MSTLPIFQLRNKEPVSVHSVATWCCLVNCRTYFYGILEQKIAAMTIFVKTKHSDIE
jgi:hypothetical protein